MSDNTTGLVINTAIQESIAARLRPRLLEEVANLQESDIAYFQKKRLRSISAATSDIPDLPSLTQTELTDLGRVNRIRFWKMSDVEIIKLRDELRSLWNAVSVRSEDAQRAIAHWLDWRPSRNEVGQERYSPFFPSLELGRIVMDVRNLHAQMAQAVLDEAKYMKVCGNPDCSNRYFVASRTDSKYCEQGECTRYGQKVASRESWRKTHAVKEAECRIKTEEAIDQETSVSNPQKAKGSTYGRSSTRKTKK
jgi:hypothetical protein